MRGFSLLFSRDMRDLAGGVAFRVIGIGLALLSVALAAGSAALIAASSSSLSPKAAIGTMLYFATLLPFLAFVWAFAGPALMQEKTSGHLEALLATPLSPRTIWLAKTATMAIPALAFEALSSALMAVGIAAATRSLPAEAFPWLPAPTILVCLLGNPLLFTGLGALTVAIAFRYSPEAAIIPSFALGFGLMTVIPVGASLRIIDLSSWAFASAYLGAGALEWMLVLGLERGMTKERIVLSSRED